MGNRTRSTKLDLLVNSLGVVIFGIFTVFLFRDATTPLTLLGAWVMAAGTLSFVIRTLLTLRRVD